MAKITIEKLAEMINKGFDNTPTKSQFESLEKDVKSVERDIKSVKERLGSVEENVKEIKTKLAEVGVL